VAVKIKLKRLGRTRVPTYRIVVADARTKRDGRAIEEIGKYHPKEEPSLIQVNSERAQHWLAVGAQPTAPVMNILKITGDWQKFKGEPGSEGTLRTREPVTDKKEVFAEALKSVAKDSGDSGSTTPRGGGRARKADSSKTEKADKADKSDGKAQAKAAATAETKDAKDAKVTKPESGRSKSKASAEKTAAGSADDSAAAAATASPDSASPDPASADPASPDPASTGASGSSEPGSEA
jgi:small subunit ribosomal protein S16